MIQMDTSIPTNIDGLCFFNLSRHVVCVWHGICSTSRLWLWRTNNQAGWGEWKTCADNIWWVRHARRQNHCFNLGPPASATRSKGQIAVGPGPASHFIVEANEGMIDQKNYYSTQIVSCICMRHDRLATYVAPCMHALQAPGHVAGKSMGGPVRSVVVTSHLVHALSLRRSRSALYGSDQRVPDQ
jgi:hypothetical protein